MDSALDSPEVGEKDFDEMLRAGLISPGSSPFVESRRAPAGERASHVTVTVHSEQRISGEAQLETFDAAGRVVPRPLTLIQSPNEGMARSLANALRFLVTPALSVGNRNRSDFELIIVDAAMPDLALWLDLRLPCLVLARDHEWAAAAATIAGRSIEILSVPYKLKRVIKAVRRAVIPAAPPAPG